MTTRIDMIRDELVGRVVLGRYRVMLPLARGGMGLVYLGRLEGAAGFSRPVVIKRIIPDLGGDETVSQLFVREARILSNLQHPNIVGVLDFGLEDGAYVMVLDYVHGYNLAEWERHARDLQQMMPLQHALLIVTRVLDALHYAHTFKRGDGTELNIVHRDVSTSNILLDEQAQVKLHDFGIARTDEASEYKTQEATFKGKLVFAPPESVTLAVATPASDVYSAGVVLYQLLAGENPFRASNASQTLYRLLHHVPTPLSRLRGDIPPRLDDVLSRAMAKHPARRYQSAAEFADALRALAEPERDVQEDLALALQRDFARMPETLNVLSLDDRDLAWRRELSPAWGSPAPSTATPAELLVARAPSPPPVAVSPPTATLKELNGAGASRASSSKARLIVAGGAAALLAASAGAAAMLRAPSAPPATRYMVVERGAAAATSAEPRPVSEASSAAATQTAEVPIDTAPSAALAREVVSPSPPTTPQRPDATRLSATFRAQQPKVERCFASHVSDLEQPQVSIRFKADSAGRVTSAELVPSSLSSSALGQCLLGVARSTSFGPQGRDVTFTIPITARRVKR